MIKKFNFFFLLPNFILVIFPFILRFIFQLMLSFTFLSICLKFFILFTFFNRISLLKYIFITI